MRGTRLASRHGIRLRRVAGNGRTWSDGRRTIMERSSCRGSPDQRGVNEIEGCRFSSAHSGPPSWIDSGFTLTGRADHEQRRIDRRRGYRSGAGVHAGQGLVSARVCGGFSRSRGAVGRGAGVFAGWSGAGVFVGWSGPGVSAGPSGKGVAAGWPGRGVSDGAGVSPPETSGRHSSSLSAV